MAASSLRGKNIAVTGAASGMGLAVCTKLASLGANVSMADAAGEAALEEARAGVEGAARAAGFADARVVATRADVRSTEAVDAWMRRTLETVGRLHGAANFAGVTGAQMNRVSIEDVTDEDWDYVVGVNLTGVMKSMRAEVRAFAEEGGSIVNAASICAVVGSKNRDTYTASKHGVIGLSRAAARSLAPKKIRVNVVNPGYIATPMLGGTTNLATVESLPEVQATAMQRCGTVDEIVPTVIFLLSSDSSFTTGAIHQVDGGWWC